MDRKTHSELIWLKGNEAYHRKMMEYFREKIDILKKEKKKNGST